MLVGWGGNNGSTYTAGGIAKRKKRTWTIKTGKKHASFYKSLTQSVSVHLGFQNNVYGGLEDVYRLFNEISPLVDPFDFEIMGWDTSELNLDHSCYRARVIEPVVIGLMNRGLSSRTPFMIVSNSKYIASNQAVRVHNIIMTPTLGALRNLKRHQ